MDKIKDKIQNCCLTRTVLWYFVFFGFGVNYMVRINLNIAIVSMITTRPKGNLSITSECLLNDRYRLEDSNKSELSLNENITSITTNSSGTSFLHPLSQLSNTSKEGHESRLFTWDEKQQGLILGGFYWFHWLTQVPGGMLATKYGTKLVFGLSNFVGALLCLFMPLAASWGYSSLFAIRILQGISMGFSWPAMHNMTAKWIPPNERSKFVTAYLGSSVGAALTYMMCGIIIHAWGWEAVFYVSGIIGIVWCALWWFLVYDSPTEHPRISPDEKEYITNSLGQTSTKEKGPVPWRLILTSKPVWINILAHVGGLWGMYTLLTTAPSYFKFIHGWNITATGFLSGMPQLLRMLVAYIISQIGDYILTKNKLSRTNVRKIATGLSTIGQACCMLALAYAGCNSTAAIVFLSAAVAIHGTVSTGCLASLVDISPNYAGITLGLANSLFCISGLATPTVIGYLTHNNQTVAQWQKAFLLATVILLASGVIYCCFSSSKLQVWNTPSDKTTVGSELLVLNLEKNIRYKNRKLEDSNISDNEPILK